MAEHDLNKIVDDDGEVFNLRDSTKQPVADRVTSIRDASSASDDKYPSEKAVATAIGSVDTNKMNTNGSNATSAAGGNIIRAMNDWNYPTDSEMIGAATLDSQGKYTLAKIWNYFKGKFDSSLSESSTSALQTKEITRWVNLAIGDDGYFSGSAANPQLSVEKAVVGGLSLRNEDVKIKIYTFDEGDEDNATLVWDIDTASDDIKSKFKKAQQLGTVYQSEAGKCVKIWCDTYTSAGCYFRALAIFMDTKDTSSSVSTFYGHLRTLGTTSVDYPEYQFQTWGSSLTVTYSKSRVGHVEIVLRPKTSNAKCRIYGFRCLNTNTNEEKAVLLGSANKITTARKLKTNLARTADSTFDGSADQENIPVTGILPLGNGGTGKTKATAAEYNLTTGKSEISDTTSGDDRVVFELASPSESNGVTRGFRKLSTIWTWIKGLLSSESGVNISGSSASCTGNAATATAAQSGSALETAINGKMNTSASNATAPSGSGGDGATATLLNNLTEGTSDIVTTDNGDNVFIATTNNGGSVTNKWYKRKLVKLIPWIIKKLGTRLVYDCGAGSTSGDDFDAALAAFNAGQWVIIRKDGNAYHCVGTYNSGLRFKQIANDASLLKVNTLSWTRGSSPSVGTQIEASLSGHTHTRSDITNFAHTHGNIQDSGALQTSDVTIASGDKLVITDSSDSSKVARASASFDGSTTTKALTQKGTFETFMTPSASNAASGALQNLTAQLTEGTSDFTDNTEIFTSYAGNSGFAESGHVNQPYRRKASSMLNYVRDWFAIDRSPANVGTTHKRISLGYGKYSSSNYVGAMTYIVRLFFNYADDGGLQGKGITVLVTYDFRWSGTQKSECRILSDNGVRDAGYNVVLANYVTGSGDNGKLYICIGLVKNSAPTTLVEFNYSYCKIFRVGTVGDWVQDISSDAVGTYDNLIQATDLVSAAVNADMVDGKHIVIGSWAGASNTIYFG